LELILTVKHLLYYYWYKMYCTIVPAAKSSATLSPEAAESVRRLQEHASVLAFFSPSVATAADAVGDAYALALASGSREDWARFVGLAASLARHDAVFAQIATENDDLLAREMAFA
jgi:hypothetical protein